MGDFSKKQSSKAILLIAVALSFAFVLSSNGLAQSLESVNPATPLVNPVGPLGNQNNSWNSDSALEQGMINRQGEEIVSPADGFTAVVTITDAQLELLVRQGTLRINVPANLRNSIRSIVIQRPVYFKEKRATSYPDASMTGNEVLIEISNSLLERIDYQPVELKFYESGVDRVVLKYTGLAPNRKDISQVGDPASDSPIVFVKLKSGKGIEGRIKGMSKLNIESQFGSLKLDFSSIAKISFSPEGKLMTQMANGDLISGTISGDSIELLNLWGNEAIQFSEVDAITPGRRKAIPRTKKTIKPPNGSLQRGTIFQIPSQRNPVTGYPVPTQTFDQNFVPPGAR